MSIEEIPLIIPCEDVDFSKIVIGQPMAFRLHQFSYQIRGLFWRSEINTPESSIRYTDTVKFIIETPEITFKLSTSEEFQTEKIVIRLMEYPETKINRELGSMMEKLVAGFNGALRKGVEGIFDPQIFKRFVSLRIPSSKIDEKNILKCGVFFYRTDQEGYLTKGAKKAKNITITEDLTSLLGTAEHKGKFICEFELFEKINPNSNESIINPFTLRMNVLQMSINMPKVKNASPSSRSVFQNNYAFSDRELHSKRLIGGRDVLAELDEMRKFIFGLPGIGPLYHEAANDFQSKI